MIFHSPISQVIHSRGTKSRLFVQFCATIIMMLVVYPVHAQQGPFFYERPVENKPQKNLEGVAVNESQGKVIPLDLMFLNSKNESVSLESFLKPGRPLLITMNYSSCPMLCSQQLTSMVQVMGELEEKAGNDFQLLSISYDPSETPELAGERKKRFLSEYGKATTPDAWEFLVSPHQQDIKKLAESLGIAYRYIPERKEYSHPAVIVFVASDGKIAQYLHGVGYEKELFQQAISNTRRGIIQIPGSQGIYPLFCSFFDPESGSYAGAAVTAMRIGAFLFLLCFVGLFWVMSRMVKYKKQQLEHTQKVMNPANQV